MLLKIFVDNSFPIPTKPMTAAWVVQDNLPLSHPQNIQSFMQALRKPANTPFTFDGLYVITQGGLVLDVARSAADLSLAANAQLTVNRQPPAQSPRRPRSSSHHGREGESPIISPRPNEDEEDPQASSLRGQSMIVAEAADDDEYYVSAECGWFPFSLRPDRSNAVVAVVIDPQTEPTIDDREPNTIALCDGCSQLVAHTDCLKANVDRHYKPMLLETTVQEGWVEKLGGGRIQRWQKRWLCVSEQSMDWYEEKPKDGVKPKIRGSRPLQQNDEFSITSIVTNVDPKQYPKANDNKFHYFVIVFKNPEQVTLYRVPTPQEKSRFVGFFTRLAKRWAQSGAASRDPVFWKQWADLILTATSDIGDVCLHREDAFDEEERESAVLRETMQRLHDGRPTLHELVQKRLDRVEELKAKLRALDDVRLRHRKVAEAAEAKVAAEEVRLNELTQECSEEVRHHKFLEQRAEEQRLLAATEIAALDSEIELGIAAKRRAFGMWRRLEEHHADKSDEKQNMREYSFSVDL
jgi:hypothetical protein